MVAQLLLGVQGLSYASLLRRLDEALQDPEKAQRRSGSRRAPPRPGVGAAPALGAARALRSDEPSPWAS